MTLPTPEPGENGLDFLRRIFHPGEPGEPMAPIAELLGMSAVAVELGEVVFELTPTRQHYNPIGTVHAGIASTLIDSVMGSAVQTRLDPGFGYTTLDLHVNFVRALTDQVGPIRGEGKVVHFGRRTATAEGRVVDATGKLYAHGTCTCLIVPPS